jgi:predicted enzyme related to lactoylglutathione lyase
VDDIDRSIARAVELGGRLYRGPLKRLDGKFMCQVKDPFGNVIGMIGSRKK